MRFSKCSISSTIPTPVLQARHTHPRNSPVSVGNVSLAAEAGSHVGVPDSYACCLARPCDCFPTTQDRETIRTHPPSRQAPKSCINLVLSPRACSSLKSAANCSSSNLIRADAPQYPTAIELIKTTNKALNRRIRRSVAQANATFVLAARQDPQGWEARSL